VADVSCHLGEVDPSLAEDALAEIPHVGLGLAREQALKEAVLWIWREDIPLDDPRLEDHLRGGLPGSYSPWSQARLQLEARVREVLAAIADKVNGTLKFYAIDPRTNGPIEPDPALLRDLLGSDRSRNRIPTSIGPIRHLVFVGSPELEDLEDQLQKFAQQECERLRREGHPPHRCRASRGELVRYAIETLNLSYRDALKLYGSVPVSLKFQQGRPGKKNAQ
jgi:hypothetical protein